jgi:alkylhydroperoxidase family enzyme
VATVSFHERLRLSCHSCPVGGVFMGVHRERETDMTAGARIPRAELTGIKGALLKLVLRKKIGRVPDNVEVMWNHPAVFMDLMRMGGKVEKWDRLDPHLASFAGMAAAAEIGCSMCLDLNYFLAHDKGLSVDKAREVPRWRNAEVFTPLERRVMEYAEAMCQTPLTVTDEMSAALLADLGAAGLLELTARIGYMNVAARSNVALGIRSEHFADSCGLPPIATRPVEASTP